MNWTMTSNNTWQPDGCSYIKVVREATEVFGPDSWVVYGVSKTGRWAFGNLAEAKAFVKYSLYPRAAEGEKTCRPVFLP